MSGRNHHSPEFMKGDNREPELIAALEDKHHLVTLADTQLLEEGGRAVALALHVGKRELAHLIPVVGPEQRRFVGVALSPAVDHIIAEIEILRHHHLIILFKIRIILECGLS